MSDALTLPRTLTTPAKIQRFLDEELGYNLEPGGDTCYSPRTVLQKRVAHCMEGAMLAAAALRRLGHPPLLVDLEAVRDTDHVLAVYRDNGHWGAVAKSDYSGLRSREPVYRTIRELVMSYFEHYFNPAGEKTLRALFKAGQPEPVRPPFLDDVGGGRLDRPQLSVRAQAHACRLESDVAQSRADGQAIVRRRPPGRARALI